MIDVGLSLESASKSKIRTPRVEATIQPGHRITSGLGYINESERGFALQDRYVINRPITAQENRLFSFNSDCSGSTQLIDGIHDIMVQGDTGTAYYFGDSYVVQYVSNDGLNYTGTTIPFDSNFRPSEQYSLASNEQAYGITGNIMTSYTFDGASMTTNYLKDPVVGSTVLTTKITAIETTDGRDAIYVSSRGVSNTNTELLVEGVRVYISDGMNVYYQYDLYNTETADKPHKITSISKGISFYYMSSSYQEDLQFVNPFFFGGSEQPEYQKSVYSILKSVDGLHWSPGYVYKTDSDDAGIPEPVIGGISNLHHFIFLNGITTVASNYVEPVDVTDSIISYNNTDNNRIRLTLSNTKRAGEDDIEPVTEFGSPIGLLLSLTET